MDTSQIHIVLSISCFFVLLCVYLFEPRIGRFVKLKYSFCFWEWALSAIVVLLASAIYNKKLRWSIGNVFCY